MAQESAGVLLYRRQPGPLQVLLAHPGGPFWRSRDAGAWTLPKGRVEPGETPEAAARREFEEETGHPPPRDLHALARIRQRGGKWVHAFVGEGGFDPATLRGNAFTVEWPPRSGCVASFPEVDRVDWFDLPQARVKLLASQVVLLDHLARHLGGTAQAPITGRMPDQGGPAG